MTNVTIEKEKLEKVLEALELSSVMVDSFGLQKKMQEAHATIKQALAAPVQKRPPNCGTGYCSCVECVMEPAAQPAQQEPINVAQAYAMAQVCLDLHDALGCKWGDNPYLAIDRLKTAAPSQPVGTYGEIHESMQALLRSGLQRDQQIYMAMKDRPLYTIPPAAPIPDAITDNSESVEYRSGWNDCRELTIQMRKP
jgi:hypothetical protein